MCLSISYIELAVYQIIKGKCLVLRVGTHTCAVYAKGYVNGRVCLYIYMCHKYHLFGIFLIKKIPKKSSWHFPFVHRHLKWDSRLPVAPGWVPLLFLCLYSCDSSKLRDLGVRRIMRCGYFHMPRLIIMHNIFSSMWLLRLNSACSAECQQLQCSIVACKVF